MLLVEFCFSPFCTFAYLVECSSSFVVVCAALRCLSCCLDSQASIGSPMDGLPYLMKAFVGSIPIQKYLGSMALRDPKEHLPSPDPCQHGCQSSWPRFLSSMSPQCQVKPSAGRPRVQNCPGLMMEYQPLRDLRIDCKLESNRTRGHSSYPTMFYAEHYARD